MQPAFSCDDTVVAIASASGAGLRGVIRLSGPETLEICARTFGWSTDGGQKLYRRVIPARLELASAASAEAGPMVLDGALLLWPDHRSYTGQPAAEWHGLAPRPLLERAVHRFLDAGARLARPGEFTMRAFLAGRFDLSQAEAVLGLIHAQNDRQFESGLRQLAGGLAAPLAALREKLLCILADLEAGLDFADEDIEFIDAETLRSRLAECWDDLDRLRGQINSRGDSAGCPTVVLAGAPNAGKSSLFNALSGEQASLVSAEPGTTRDGLERRVAWHGTELILLDTAGLDPVVGADSATPDSDAQVHAARTIQSASLLVFCVDGSEPGNAGRSPNPAFPQDRLLLVRTKADLTQRADLPAFAVAVSACTGAGIAELRSLVVEKTRALNETGVDVTPATLLRSAGSLAAAARSLLAALDGSGRLGDELVAAEIRSALAALGEVSGIVRTDELLDRIFSRFCLGK